MSQIRLTAGRGIHITHENGVTLSIQIGGGNYCDNYNEPISRPDYDKHYQLPPSSTAEIAVWVDRGDMVNIDGDQVKGYVPVKNVLRFNTFLSGLPNKMSSKQLEKAIAGFDWEGLEQ